MDTFDLSYKTKTSNNQLNFVGSTIRYFDVINKDNLEKTNEQYIDYYNKHIFPFINTNIPVEEYNPENIEELIVKIKESNNYSETTIDSTIRHLVYDPIKFWNDEFRKDYKEFYITANDFSLDDHDNIEEALYKIKKSLTISEEKKIFENLFNDPFTEEGEKVGLAIMFMTVARNSEACGLNFSDLKEMNEYKGSYYLEITSTTETDSNKLKGGGKTKNAVRRIPVIDVLKDFILERKSYLESQISFPYEYRGITYENVNEMPMVCRSANYGARANGRDLTYLGKIMLRNLLKLTKREVAGIEYLIANDKNSDYDLGEKDATTYLLRRNMATHLYTLGLNSVEREYVMGHELENTAYKRSDFDEKLLYEMLCKLQKHPLNNYENLFKKDVDGKMINVKNVTNVKLKLSSNTSDSYVVTINNREINDGIKIKIDGEFVSCNVVEVQTNEINDDQINITSTIKKSFENN